MIKETEKEETIQEKWEKLYTSISLHGFRYIFETTGITRILWTILFVGMVGFSVLLFYGNVSDFIHYKTTTLQEEIFNIEHLEFPTVTICNMNSVSAKKLNQANITSVTQQELLEFYQNLRQGDIDEEINGKRILQALKEERNVSTWMEIVTMFELGIEEMMHDEILNSFVEEPCTFNDEICNETDFIPIVSEEFGLCFQYNSFYQNKSMHATSSGVRSGLHLYLNIHEDDMLISDVPYQGLSVIIHPPGTPFESSIAKRAPVRPGSFSFMHVKINVMELLGSPYHTKCSSKPYKYVRPNVPYFNSMCTMDCLIDKMVEHCGCVALEMSHHTDKVNVCSFDKIGCMEKMSANFSQIMFNCRKGCPTECKLITYHIDSAQTIIGNKIVNMNVKEFFNTTKESIEYIQKNIVGIDVAFADLSYRKGIVKPTTSWSVLLGAIGGNLGLCLGSSLVTFIELVVFSVELLFKKLRRKENQDVVIGDDRKMLKNITNADTVDESC